VTVGARVLWSSFHDAASVIMMWMKTLPFPAYNVRLGSDTACMQVLGEIMEQEGATIFNGARYKPLPAIAQARCASSHSGVCK